jgi:hypothetical protein
MKIKVLSSDRSFILMFDQDTSKYFEDDGTEINPDLIPKPDLCITCKKDGRPGEEEILCNLTRTGQHVEETFVCEAYEPEERK